MTFYLLHTIRFFLTRKTGGLLLLFLLFISIGFAQSDAKKIEIYFENDTIAVTQGQTFTNFLFVKNATDHKLKLSNFISDEQYPGLLLLSKPSLIIESGTTQKLFVKFIATTAFMKLEKEAFNFSLSYSGSDDTTAQVAKATFYRKIKDEDDIFIYPVVRENYVDPLLPETNLSFFVENSGYARRSLLLEFESNFAGLQVVPKSIIVDLEGKQKQIIDLKLAVRQQNSYFPSYDIQVKVIDQIKNKAVAFNNIKVMVLSSSTQVMRNGNFATDKNFMELNYNQSNNGFDYTKFTANASLPIGSQVRSTFNTEIDYFNNDTNYSIYTTFLDLERKGSSVRIGSVYGTDYDFSISGRGVKALANLGTNKVVEVLAVDNSYTIYSNYIAEQENAKIIATKYSFGTSAGFNGKVSYVYNYDALQAITSHVSHFNSAFTIGKSHNFRTELGVSNEKGLLNNNAQAGLMSALSYDYRGERWELNSLNTVASNSYAGMNRGTVHLNQNLGYRFSERGRLFLHYQNQQSHPNYLTRQYQPDYFGPEPPKPYTFNRTHSLQSGIQFSTKQWNISVAPQIEKQENNSNYLMRSLLSYRLRASVSTSFKAHQMNFSTEYSYSDTAQLSDDFSSLKSSLSYSYKNFSLNGTLQYNPDSVYDLNYFSEATKDFTNYSLYSSYNFKVLQDKVSGYLSAGVNYSELYNNINQNLNATLEYKITSSWAGTGYANYSNYESLRSSSFKGVTYQFRLGIKKYFSNATMDANPTINFQFYQDQNLNGIFDKDELVLPNQIIKLDNYTAKTDKKGKVSFKNVPKGRYILRVNESRGVRLMIDPIIVVEKRINLQIGLGRNNLVKGSLSEIKQLYDDLESDVRGILIYAEDEKGEKTYTAIDQKNEFEFYLKNGTYRIYIENSRYEFLNASQVVQLDNGDYPGVLLFEYRKKDRQIKVKKF